MLQTPMAFPMMIQSNAQARDFGVKEPWNRWKPAIPNQAGPGWPGMTLISFSDVEGYGV